MLATSVGVFKSIHHDEKISHPRDSRVEGLDSMATALRMSCVDERGYKSSSTVLVALHCSEIPPCVFTDIENIS
jgi:hypothetical protein